MALSNRLLAAAAAVLLLPAFLSGCGSSESAGDDAAPTEDGAPRGGDSGPGEGDGGTGTADASTGDGDASASPPTSEVTSGGIRLGGPTYQMDVQIGHPVSQEPMQGSQTTMEGNAAVKP